MKLKRFVGTNMQEAMQKLRSELGADAVIISNRNTGNGVEILSAVDFDERILEKTREEQVPRTESAPPEQQKITTPSENHNLWEDDDVRLMKDELKSLRGLVEVHLSGLAWRQNEQVGPMKMVIFKRLLNYGFSPKLCQSLVDSITSENNTDKAWDETLTAFAAKLPVLDDPVLSKGGIVALVGSTGVGKTTTIAKLAARYVKQHGPDSVALITSDVYRIAAYDQLKTYGRILGTSVYTVDDGNSLRDTLQACQDKSLVLIDTAGMSQRDLRLTDELTMLKEVGKPLSCYLCVSAIGQNSVIDEVMNAFNKIKLDGCIITKLDESLALGEIMSSIIKHQLPIAYITDGQRVPEDLHNVSTRALTRRVFESEGQLNNEWDEKALAFYYNKQLVAESS